MPDGAECPHKSRGVHRPGRQQQGRRRRRRERRGRGARHERAVAERTEGRPRRVQARVAEHDRRDEQSARKGWTSPPWTSSCSSTSWDTIRTIQRMGRTGRARDGKVVVLALEGREAEKFSKEQGKYEHLLRSLSDPGRCFQLCNDCPRMLPAGLDPRCELKELGPTPEALKAKREMEARGSSGKKRKGARGGRGPRQRERVLDPPVGRAADDGGALALAGVRLRPPRDGADRHAERGAASAAPRRPCSSVPHGRMCVALMRAMSAAQGLPPPLDVRGESIEGGAIAREEKAKADAEAARDRAHAEANADAPTTAFYAPPVEWDDDEWGDGGVRARSVRRRRRRRRDRRRRRAASSELGLSSGRTGTKPPSLDASAVKDDGPRASVSQAPTELDERAACEYDDDDVTRSIDASGSHGGFNGVGGRRRAHRGDAAVGFHGHARRPVAAARRRERGRAVRKPRVRGDRLR